ncbi:MAG: hypothetical protein IKA88_07315 [Clostridia bacterium]|nr:hypothetical protein [Clostridia bacterium]
MAKKNKIRLSAALAATIVGVAGAISIVKAQDAIADTYTIPSYEVSSTSSSVRYGSFERLPDTEGIAVELMNGDVFRYNKPIDLRGMTSVDPLVEICVVPEEFGVADCTSMQIILTDVYDEKNTVTVDVHDADGLKNMSYATASAAGQPFKGCENGGKIWTGTRWGQWVWMSFFGETNSNITSHDNNKICLAYDYANKAVNFYAHAATRVFADFDDPDYYPELWEGFTTGEVFLSIKCDNYVNPRANFVVTQVQNHDLSQAEYTDDVAPVINIDYNGYENALPTAVVGRPYSVFDALGADNRDGYIDPQVKVYRNYTMSKKANVACDGETFIPTAADTYYIVYTAEDEFENLTTEVVAVKAVDATNPITLTFTQGETAGVIGNEIRLPSVTTNGGSGRVALTESLTVNGKEYTISDGYFTPYEAGEYIYTVTGTDYVGQYKTETYKIQIETTDVPVFKAKPTLPKYFLVGKSYTLPTVTAYDYSDNSERTITTKVYEKVGETEKEISGAYVPEQAGDVTIVYKANNGLKEASISYPATAVDVSGAEGISVAKYFYGENIAVTSYDTYVNLAATEVCDVSAEYVMPMSTFLTNVAFNVPQESGNFKYLNFYYYNYHNPDNFLKFTYENIGNGNLRFYVNGNSAVATSLLLKFDGTANTFTLNGKKKTVLADSTLGQLTPVTEYANGTPLKTSVLDSLCYFKVELAGVTGAAAINISNLSSQQMSKDEFDMQEPLVYVQSSVLGDMSLNTEFTLPAACIFDMLDPEITTALKITKPDGTCVVDVNGLELNQVAIDRAYTFVFDSYGTYRITYYAADSSGNMNLMAGFVIGVIDEVAPEITFAEKIISQVEVGTAIYIPPMTVTDNYSQTVEKQIFVIASNGNVYKISEGTDGFVPTETGSYIVRYIAIDEFGNMNMQQFVVNVMERVVDKTQEGGKAA